MERGGRGWGKKVKCARESARVARARGGGVWDGEGGLTGTGRWRGRARRMEGGGMGEGGWGREGGWGFGQWREGGREDWEGRGGNWGNGRRGRDSRERQGDFFFFFFLAKRGRFQFLWQNGEMGRFRPHWVGNLAAQID